MKLELLCLGFITVQVILTVCVGAFSYHWVSQVVLEISYILEGL